MIPIDVNIDVNLIKLVTVSSHLVFFLNYIKIGEDTLISLAFSLLSEKNHLFCKLQLFPQNTDAFHFHFPKGFCMFQRTGNEYNNLQIPEKKESALIPTVKTPGTSFWYLYC